MMLTSNPFFTFNSSTTLTDEVEMEAYKETCALLEFPTAGVIAASASTAASMTKEERKNAISTSLAVDEEMKQSPINASSYSEECPLVTPGSLCSSSSAFFQRSQVIKSSSNKQPRNNSKQLIHSTTTEPQPSVLLPLRFRSQSDPTVLTSSSTFLPTVSIEDSTAQEMERMGVEPSILRSPSNLARAVHMLEQRTSHNASSGAPTSSTADPWNSDEASSIPQCELPIITQLTGILFGEAEAANIVASSSKDYMTQLFAKASTPRRVCQHPFRKNDIVWVCRTCQSDETCVLCHKCWTRSNHDGHDVAFYHAQAGGCCDCGDPDAWDPRGFCDVHGGGDKNINNTNSSVDTAMLSRTRGIVTAIMDWFTQVIVKDVETSFYPTTATAIHANVSSNNVSSSALDESSVPPDVLEDLNRSLIMGSTNHRPQHPLLDAAMSGDTRSFYSSLSNPMSSNPSVDIVENAAEEAISSYDDEIMQEEDDDGFFHRTDNVQQSLQQQPPPSILSVQAESRLTREASKAHYKEIDRAAHELGEAGRTQGGLYLILFSQDASFYTDMQGSAISESCISAVLDVLGAGAARNSASISSSLRKILLLCKNFGELSILGTSEILSALGIDTGMCWRDGDVVKTTLVGKWILDQKLKLTSTLWNVAIKTHAQLLREQRASAIISWLGLLTRASDNLCQTMAEAISGRHHLVAILNGDLMLSRHLTKRWHALLLTLLAVPRFKMELAEAYCETYGKVTKDYARGIGVSEASSFTLSVQFLNRQTYVRELAANWVLLQRLSAALLSTLKVALCRQVRKVIPAIADGQQPSVVHEEVLDPNQPVLMQRRYNPCISDIKCVLNVQGMPRLFASVSLFTFLQTLKVAQGMDKQVWRCWSMDHVDNDPRGWVGAFNCSISLGCIFERILSWQDDTADPKLLTCAEICDATWCAVAKWQQGEISNYQSTGNSPKLQAHECSSAALPYSTVHYLYGTSTAQPAFPVSQIEPWSFHYPLHRFFSVCLRELCRRTTGSRDLASWLTKKTAIPDDEGIWRTLLEFPVLALSRAAQIRSNLWRRNGSGMQDQVLNYAEPPFCRSLRDADFALVQFATVALNISCESKCNSNHPSSGGTASLINLLLHRFGVFDFVGFSKAPHLNREKYLAEVEDGILPPELSPCTSGSEDEFVHPWKEGYDRLPWTYYPARGDVVASLSLLEELMNTLIILITELPSPAPIDEKSQLDQAKHRLRREVVHRLVSGPKTHSELIEVHQVLPQSENSVLSEEGKRFNPNDAGGALLELTLAEVAERKPTSGFDPDQWLLKKNVYLEYDPSFYHVPPRAHQSAAENRSTCMGNVKGDDFFNTPTPCAPRPSPAHSFLKRIRRDLTADSATIALIYRTLHIHCSNESFTEDIDESFKDGKGKSLHEIDCMSETSLARSIHLLTLAAYCWEDEGADTDWKKYGGGGVGSIFYGRLSNPGPQEWVQCVMLGCPAIIMQSDCFSKEESILILLQRLASKGSGRGGAFAVQDAALRSGAAWLCRFASRNNRHAASIVEGTSIKPSKNSDDLERRRREAKERALLRMKRFQEKFADSLPPSEVVSSNRSESEQAASKSSDQESLCSFDSKIEAHDDTSMDLENRNDVVERRSALLKERPRCIVCDDDGNTSALEAEKHVSIRSKTREQSDALSFCAFAQASMVLKGTSSGEPLSPAVDKFCSVYINLCGHAIHASCCDAYLASTSLRDGAVDPGKNGEFRCPMCKRFSNCLVPFIDVDASWVQSQQFHPEHDAISSRSYKLDDRGQKSTNSLDRFLSPDSYILNNAGWDGRCNFRRSEVLTPEILPAERKSAETNKSRRRKVRSFAKKDFFSAWSLVMRSTRRKKTSSKLVPSILDAPQELSSDESLSGSMEVFRRLTAQLLDIAYKVDLKRFSEHDLTHFGEFRHYLTEQIVYNVYGRDQLLSQVYEWPMCIPGETLPTELQHDFDKEKFFSQLLFSVQSFVYSCCSEAAEVRRAYELATKTGRFRSRDNYLSKFGVTGVQYNGMLVVMPTPTLEDGGVHIFDGRLGKLRYIALAVISASASTCPEVIQLSFSFPVCGKQPSNAQTYSHTSTSRAPIAYPVLAGHVLSHTVAAMCAACGAKRASMKSNCGDETASDDSNFDIWEDCDVISSCENFIKLGFLARVLQALLGSLVVYSTGTVGDLGKTEECICDAVDYVIDSRPQSLISDWDDRGWANSCAVLMKAALSTNVLEKKDFQDKSNVNKDVIERFHVACLTARIAGESFLADAALILQIVAPGALFYSRPDHDSSPSVSCTLEGLYQWLRMEPMSEMLQSTRLRSVVSHWYSEASKLWRDSIDSKSEISKLLSHTPEFPVFDWPFFRTHRAENCSVEDSETVDSYKCAKAMLASSPKFPILTSKRMLCEGSGFDGSVGAPTHISSTKQALHRLLPLPEIHSKKCVPLLGVTVPSVRFFRNYKENGVAIGEAMLRMPRIESLPTSYTDLYANLCSLLPSEQTAVCLVCGTVLNAGGKGECTKHAMECGAGCGLFFLLQECVGLILHEKKAAYVHSPYVDSHGETPQFRGRPLNLDLERYEILQEMWCSHSIRQKVMAERANARQVIIANFY